VRLAVVSTRGWQASPQAALALVARLIESPNPNHVCIVIDSAAVQVAARDTPVSAALPHTLIAFAAWLKPGAVEDSVIDTHRIRAAPAEMALDRPVILDGSGHRFELIAAALAQCRHAWFPLDQWHPAFAIICDEINLLPLADALAGTFYCQPGNISDRDLNRLVSDHQSRAFIFRWFGYTTGRYSRALALRIKRLRLAVETRIRNI